MDFAPIRKRLPFAVALIFFVVAYSRPDQRGVWMILGAVCLGIGLRRKKAPEVPSAPTGV